MKLLNKYIIKHVIGATVIVALIFVGINFFIDFAAELSDIGTRNYNLWRAFLYVLMQTPFNFYQLFPMAGLLGALVGLGQLSSSNQLVVMRSSGYSILQVVGSVTQAAIIMFIVAAAIGEGAAPYLMQYSTVYKNEAMGVANAQDAAQQNIWLKHRGNFFYIKSIPRSNMLKDVVEYRFNASLGLQQVVSAAEADNVGGNWWLRQAKILTFTDKHVKASHQASAQLHAIVKPHLLNQQTIDPQELSLVSLYQVIAYRQSIGLTYTHLLYSFWQRLIAPLTLIVMMLLGVPFIFGSQRERSMGQRIVIGVVLGFGFYMLNQFLGLFSMVFNLAPMVSAAFPTVLVGILALIFLAKIR